MKAGADVMGVIIKSDDGRRMGTVTDLMFDDRCSRVLGLVMRSGYVFRTRHVIGFSEVQEISLNAVVVAGTNSRRPHADEVAARSRNHRSMRGKPVLTRHGRYLGAVEDVLFDETNGRVLGFQVCFPGASRTSRRCTGLAADNATVTAEGVVISEDDPSG